MKKVFCVCAGLLVAGMAQAAQAAVKVEAEPSPYLLLLAGVALIGTIAHRRNKLKARS